MEKNEECTVTVKTATDQLHYAKFDVSRLFCSKVIEEEPLGGRFDPPPPPLVKEGLKLS